MTRELRDQMTERQRMELSADSASYASVHARGPGPAHELLGRVAIVENDRSPPRAVQPLHEVQDRTLRPAEDRGVAEVNDGADHRVVAAGRDSGVATATSACAARAPNQ